MRLLALLFFFGALVVAASDGAQLEIKAAKARLADPREVVGATCAPAASILCRCIVDSTVRTLQAGPRELLAALERPGAVWDDLMKTLDTGMRVRIQDAKLEAEHTCRDRAGPGARRQATMERNVHASADSKPRQSLRASCSAEGGSSKACACYEQTLKTTLHPEDFEVVRADARFPPLLNDMPLERRRNTLATMAAARAACGAVLTEAKPRS